MDRRPAPGRQPTSYSVVPARGRVLADVDFAVDGQRLMRRVAQFDTLRLRLIKIAARVVEMKTMIRVHGLTSCPAQDILRASLWDAYCALVT